MEEHSSKYKLLKREYDSLLEELTDVKNELETLKVQYSENTIIQSMNDMRDRYQELVRTSVSKERYNDLLIQKNKSVDNIKAIQVILNNISKYVEPGQYILSVRLKLLCDIVDDMLSPY